MKPDQKLTEDRVLKALFEQLKRIETRVVRGFTEMGVRVTDDAEWCRIDTERREFHMKGAGKTLRVMQMALASTVGSKGDYYDVVVSGEKVATISALTIITEGERK